jgi:hypothetical protein
VSREVIEAFSQKHDCVQKREERWKSIIEEAMARGLARVTRWKREGPILMDRALEEQPAVVRFVRAVAESDLAYDPDALRLAHNIQSLEAGYCPYRRREAYLRDLQESCECWLVEHGLPTGSETAAQAGAITN